ncbi:BlaI/MecI/CopY family transcriptional regulator [Vallitalea okinawensis]|uniref:BlaI/MecI/CopY family transcriptional regulator n=1 Tax=Vallitalea okinawensis TaxID=2078660 RepID=UPI000CFDDE2F|nr:BlaI/MecI/CopY family transcriptional regulator [Vallitalea okinawensis]
MKEIPHISEAEWKVMKVIWTESPISASEIIDRLGVQSTWKPKTIKTLLSRLVKKEALDFKMDGRRYLYYPLITEKDCRKAENQSFLQKVYGGAFNVMFANFLEEQQLSKKDLEELKQILNRKEE